MTTIIRCGNRRPYISLEKALEKEYKVRGDRVRNGKQKGKLNPSISVPQILIGHKVKLVLVKTSLKKEEKKT